MRSVAGRQGPAGGWSPEALPSIVDAFLRERNLVAAGEVYVVALSGGVDSVVLLHVLRGLAPGLGISLQAAHLDHQLRAAESAEDARFCAEYAGSLGVPITVGSADVPGYQRERRLSIETAAREVRYAFLARVVRQVGARGVMVGHTADDQVETVLLHLLRGSGLGGLRGMLPVQVLRVMGATAGREIGASSGSDKTELSVMRPLLEVDRNAVRDYADHHRLAYRRDPSNEDLAFLRNKVRHVLIPAMESCVPGSRRAVSRSARLLASDFSYLESSLETTWAGMARAEGEAVALDLARLRSLHPALRALAVRRAFSVVAGDPGDLAAAHVEEVIRLAETGRTGARLALPRRVEARRAYDCLLFTPVESRLGPAGVAETRLEMKDGELEVGRWLLRVRVGELLCRPEELGPYHADLDLDRVGADLFVRGRRPGDRMRPVGLGGSKKVQDLLVDRKVPRGERDAVPVIASPSLVAWVVGHAVDERARAHAASRRVLCLRFVEKEGLSG